jgi:hypothetical protein|tara:strand:- start:192 stop:524 length:333 start_codon:yes stop_codon:yes gene_type:complete
MDKMYNFLLVKTDRKKNITTAKVKASSNTNALGFVSKVDFFEPNLVFQRIAKDLLLYPDDIQAVECPRWISSYNEPEVPSESWLCFDCEDYSANCCCDCSEDDYLKENTS